MPSPKKQRTATTDAAVAEAAPDKVELVFEWRNRVFRIDPQAFSYGRALFALRVATREGASFADQLNAMIDVFEAAIGHDQLKAALEIEPHLLDDYDHMKSLLDAMSQSVVGAPAGESRAS